MEESESSSQEELSHNEHEEVALEEEKTPTLSEPTPEAGNEDAVKKAKDGVRPRSVSAKSSRHETRTNKSLVLQMYSHMRTQRKLEQEKISKIARTDRKRQKLKGELASSCSPDNSSLNRFGASWTFDRMLKGSQRRQQPEREDSLDESSDSDNTEHSSTMADQQEDEKLESGIRSATVRFRPAILGTVGHFDGKSHEIMPSPRISIPGGSEDGRHRQRQSPLPHLSPHSQRAQTIGTLNNNNNNNPSKERSNFYYHNTKATTKHLLKGPGRIQIHFSTPPTTPGGSRRQAGSHGNSKHRQQYQWDAMPAGRFVSVQPRLITFDGSLL